MRSFDNIRKQNPGGQRRQPLSLAAGALVLVALVAAACGQAAPTNVPPTQPAVVAPTESPAPAALIPSVTVANQAIVDGKVTIAQVVSAGPGWLVIHAQKDGKPGTVLGYSPVKEGENTDVVVAIDSAQATDSLYAMLHTDAGTVGTYEFPGADVPVAGDAQVVNPEFKITGGLAVAPTESPAPAALIPSVTVADQAIVDGKVTIAQVVSAGPGWLVIHAEKDGKPGTVLGYSPVKDGLNTDVVVAIDTTKATKSVYAMLHTDAGTVGTYEFPGADVPAAGDAQAVNPKFQITGGLAAAPPAAGGTSPAVASGEAEVELEDFQFVPKELTVKVGTTVKFANKDTAEHTVTSDTNLFDSGFLAKGDTFSFTFTQPGEYPYYCAPHGAPGEVGMAGKIIVVP